MSSCSRALATGGCPDPGSTTPSDSRLSRPETSPSDPGFRACWGRIGSMRLGIAHHYGWGVAVTASADYMVVDRRRIELIERGIPSAPIHHEGGPHLLHRSGEPLDDNGLAALVVDVRASVIRAAS